MIQLNHINIIYFEFKELSQFQNMFIKMKEILIYSPLFNIGYDKLYPLWILFEFSMYILTENANEIHSLTSPYFPDFSIFYGETHHVKESFPI